MTMKLICGHILRLIQSVLGVIRRVLCFMRKRSNIGELPYTVNIASRHSSTSQSYQEVPTSMIWDNNWDEKVTIEGKIEEWRKKQVVIKRNLCPQSSTEKRNLFEFNADSKVAFLW
uniref:Ovule protein n=1 Tax=Heterorhabditis bacteriophora TaxID=37862 RepID=A0A1I7XF11_HETBA